VNFFTTRAAYPTAEEKSHVNFVVLDGPGGNTWEEKVSRTLEAMPQTAAYVKNDHLGFTVPYTIGGRTRQYHPDFLVRLAPSESAGDLVHTLIVEVSGSHKPAEQSREKARTARNQWVPAVNNHGGFGRWSYCELKNPTTFRSELEAAMQALYGGTGTSAQLGPEWDAEEEEPWLISAGEGA